MNCDKKLPNLSDLVAFLLVIFNSEFIVHD